jgi:hypothetical protein
MLLSLLYNVKARFDVEAISFLKWIFGSGGLISLWLKTSSKKKLTRRECIAIRIIWQALTSFRQSQAPSGEFL